MVRKEQAIEKCKEELSEITGWHEYNQFLCDEIKVLIPYLSADGIKHFRKEIKQIKNQSFGWSR